MSWPLTQRTFQLLSPGTRLRLSLFTKHKDLEGAATEGIVILEFPSIEAAKAWYDGGPYRCASTASKEQHIESH
jgi:uncharacterized protein (DUF1330 family)